jgi:HAE1 family hydrophobic/amphiphilic exporter-1
MVLFAVILVMGEVVDGAIVVGENIYRHRELGRPPVEAAKRGIEEVRTALLASYGTTFAGYSAMFLVHGAMGQYLRLLPIVAIFSLLAALISLFFVKPLMSVYLMEKPKKTSDALRTAQLRDDMGDAEREAAYAEAEIAGSRLKRGYRFILGTAIEHRWLVLGLVFATTAVPVGLFFSGALAFEFFPEADVPVIEVHFELPLGSSMEKKSTEVAAEIEQAVNKAVRPDEWYRPGASPERVKPVTTMGDPGALNTRIDASDGIGPEFGLVYVELESADNRERSAAEIRRAILAALPPMPGVIVRVTSPVEGPPAGAPVVLRELAQRDTTIPALAARAAEMEKLLRGIPGTRDVTSDYRVRPEIVVTPRREIASLFGVDAMQIATSVSYALEGVTVGEVDFGGRDKIELRLRNLASDRSDLRDLTDLPLRSPTGKIVSLDQVSRIERALNPSVIEHYDRKRVISVRAHLDPGTLADDVKASVIEALRTDLSRAQQRALALDRQNKVLASDDQFTLEFGGENELRDSAAGDLQIALVVAMIANLIILVVKFNEFTQPLIIVFSVPLSLIGVTLAFLVTGLNLSVMAMIGIVAVSGVVVDNAILKVEFINHWRRLGLPLEKAVIYAGVLRIRPILLTTLVTVGGLLPAALNIGGGGEVWVPLAVAFIGGLGFSTIVQLLVVPLMYYTFCGERRSKAAKRSTSPHLLTASVRSPE